MRLACRAVLLISLGCLLLLQGVAATADRAARVAPANQHFERTWARTDKPVADGAVSRTWIWGPEAFTGELREPYADAPGGERVVQYFDKSRMEINNPSGNPDTPFYVTNGLLVVEMVAGRFQTGDAAFDERPQPAAVNIAGDPGDESGLSPTYADIARYGLRSQPPLPAGSVVTQRIDGAGVVTNDPTLAAHNVIVSVHVQEPGIDHWVASVFYDFLSSEGPVSIDGQLVTDQLFEPWFYASGLPITEPFWSRVLVLGSPHDVLWQCFERRCLTYTPGNPEGFRVEAGNVGQHYHRWRYEQESIVLINEISVWPLGNAPQWIEVFNPGPGSVDLSDWSVSNQTGSRVAQLPDWTMPPGAYLQLVFSTGADEPGFDDGCATVHLDGGAGPFLAAGHDAVALYAGAPAVDMLVDFIAWTNGGSPSGLAHDHAVASGVWTAGAAFDLSQPRGPDLMTALEPGETIGRDRAAADANTPSDWATHGGPDALAASPCHANAHPLIDTPENPPLPETSKDWTVMLYFDGRDEMILGELAAELNEAEAAGSNADVTIVAQLAWRDDAGALRASRWLLQPDGNLTRLTSPRDDLDPVAVPINPGDPNALASFVSWARTSYPADRYAIGLGGNGKGWKGLMLAGPDEDFLTLSELDDGLAALGQPFELVFFESGLMAMVEVGYQLNDRADFMVASEEVMWTSVPWTDILNDLRANPGWAGGQLADRAAERTAAQSRLLIARDSQENRLAFHTIASIDLGGLATILRPAINALAINLRADIDNTGAEDTPADNGQILIKRHAQEQAERYTVAEFKDLRHVAELIGGFPISASLTTLPVVAALQEGGPVVRWEDHGPRRPNSHGLSIYFPHDLLLPDEIVEAPFPLSAGDVIVNNSFDDPLYDPATTDTHLYERDDDILLARLVAQNHPMADDPAFAFPNVATWDEFLHRYFKPVADACVRWEGECLGEVVVPVGTTLTLSGLGSSDSDGPIGPSDDLPAPDHYFWDLDTDDDHPGPIPAYATGTSYPVCSDEDCDRDEIDGADDDLDATGPLVGFTCAESGVHDIRLIVWDEHNDQGRQRNEDRSHNDGRHWLHFNVDDDWVTVRCGLGTFPATKSASPAIVGPGDFIEYRVVMSANPELEGDSQGFISDPISPDLIPPGGDALVVQVTCNIGVCAYNSQNDEVAWVGDLRPGDLVVMTILVQVPDDLPDAEYPDEYVNCVSGFDGLESFSNICATTLVTLDQPAPGAGADPVSARPGALQAVPPARRLVQSS
jgi:hypothetical protein